MIAVQEKVVDQELSVDVGFTQSTKSHPIHFVTGLIVVTIGFSAVMFVVRAAIG